MKKTKKSKRTIDELILTITKAQERLKQEFGTRVEYEFVRHTFLVMFRAQRELQAIQESGKKWWKIKFF